MRRIVVIALSAGTLAACASSGVVYTPQPFPRSGKGGAVAIPAPADPSAPPVAANPPVVVPPSGGTPPSTPSPVPAAHGNADGYALSGTALSLRGAPYRNGGIDPVAGFDC